MPSLPVAPDWARTDATAVTTWRSGGTSTGRDVRISFRELWRRSQVDTRVEAVVVLLEGSPADLALDADGDPRLGPRTCSADVRVVVAMRGIIDGLYFPLLAEADHLLAAPGTILEDAGAAPDGFLPAGLVLGLPQPELMRLALLGRLRAERAHELGFINEICDEDSILSRAVAAASQG